MSLRPEEQGSGRYAWEGQTQYLLLSLVDEGPVGPRITHKPELHAVGQRSPVEEVPELPVWRLEVWILFANNRLVYRQICRDAECAPHKDE